MPEPKQRRSEERVGQSGGAGESATAPALSHGPFAAAGPPPERKPCIHDSVRRDADMPLDDHCLLCGADGYWHNGHRHDRLHPNGHVLILLGCPDGGDEQEG